LALTVYKASAGSGKTFTLVREYIKLLIKKPSDFKHILAITFTNKATEEMKSRILKQLQVLAQGEDLDYAQSLVSQLGHPFDLERIELNAKEAYALILHNYSRFEVSTIDSFFSRILKSFAKELDLPLSYEVEMNTDHALREAKDLVFRSLDENPNLKKWLALYSIDQMEDEKSWNIDSNLERIGKNLFKEAFQAGLASTQWDLNAFEGLIKTIKKECAAFEELVKQKGRAVVKLIENSGLTFDDFHYGKSGAVNGFYKAADFDIEFHTKTRFVQTLNGDMQWAKKKGPNIDQVESLGASHLLECGHELVDIMETGLVSYNTNKAILKNIYAYGVLEALNEKLVEYRSENNIMLISDTNALLKDILAEAETPFLFEKIGSYFKHIMIDEFQDTSNFQWKNLEPLVVNALSEGHEVLIVGDVKQSIYRFRGGNMRLLLSEIKKDLRGYYIEKEVEEKTEKVLKENWRSLSNIVNFNNALYDQLKDQVKQNEHLSEAELFDLAYQDHEQNIEGGDGGYVEVKFYQEDFKEQSLLNLMSYIKRNNEMLGYAYADMLVLVNRNSEIIPIAEKLLANQIPFINAESLKLTESTMVQFIIALLKYLNNEHDEVLVAELLTLYNRLHQTDLTVHLKRKRGEPLAVSSGMFPEAFVSKKHLLKKMELFEMLTALLNIFNLKSQADAFLQQFLDVALEQSNKGNHTISSFLEWWDFEAEKQTVATSEGIDAVRIMSIHKAKGLEAPIVFIPFASWSILPNAKMHQFWTDKIPAGYEALSFIPLDYNQKLVNSQFKEPFLKETEESALDVLNKTYVATTRPREKLYIHAPKSKKPNYSRIEDLLWYAMQGMDLANEEAGDEVSFSVGNPEWSKKEGPKTAAVEIISVYPETQYSQKLTIRNESDRFFMLQEGEAANNIKFGNQVHDLLSNIQVHEDLPGAIKAMRHKGELTVEFAAEVEQRVITLLSNATVSPWFDGGFEVYNEHEIWFDGKRHQPDRVLIKENEAIIIDYKKEIPSESHFNQVRRYMNIFSKMGYDQVKGFLVYVETLDVKEVEL
jgi:ATP-dependent helicase/nuclease subunit A